MKLRNLPLITFFSFVALPVAPAEEDRKWTEELTQRVIEGKITSKKADDSEVKIETKDGDSVWIKTATLSAPDRSYIKKWIPADGILTARVVASGRGWKEVKVDIVAGANTIVVKSFRAFPNGKQGPKLTIKPGGRNTFNYKALTDYYVVAWAGDEEVDREAHNKKSGL